MQVVDASGVRPAPWFDRQGELGIANLTFVGATVFGSTGADLLELDLDAGTARTHDTAGLVDVHEMTVVEGQLLIANTGADEVVRFSIDARREVDRLRPRPGPTSSMRHAGSGLRWVDRFHLNQAVSDHHGRIVALVHHVDGRQLHKVVAERVIKMQGDGGIVDLETGARRALRLSAPHSIHAVGDEYWICNSGRGSIHRYDASWLEVGAFPISGWGRGAAVTPGAETVFVGISPIRRRYLPFRSGRPSGAPGIDVCSVAERTVVGHIEIPDVEQINNLALVDGSIADRLVSFRAG